MNQPNQSFLARWVRGETRWNAPLCLLVAVLCAGTALFVATVTQRTDIVAFNLVCAVANLLCSFLFRARYRTWLADQAAQAKRPR